MVESMQSCLCRVSAPCASVLKGLGLSAAGHFKQPPEEALDDNPGNIPTKERLNEAS